MRKEPLHKKCFCLLWWLSCNNDISCNSSSSWTWHPTWYHLVLISDSVILIHLIKMRVLKSAIHSHVFLSYSILFLIYNGKKSVVIKWRRLMLPACVRMESRPGRSLRISLENRNICVWINRNHNTAADPSTELELSFFWTRFRDGGDNVANINGPPSDSQIPRDLSAHAMATWVNNCVSVFLFKR